MCPLPFTQRKVSQQMVDALYTAHPKAAMANDSWGKCTLHDTVEETLSTKVVNTLLRKHEAGMVADDCNRFPMHCGFLSGRKLGPNSNTIVNTLLEKYAVAAR